MVLFKKLYLTFLLILLAGSSIYYFIGNSSVKVTFVANAMTMGNGTDPSTMDFFQGKQYPHLSLIIPYLNEKGIQTEVVDWKDKKVDWSKKEKLVLGPVWGYTNDMDEFVSWLDELEDRNVKMINDIKFIKWNVKKTYLELLDAAGIQIPKTMIFDSRSSADFDTALQQFKSKFNTTDIILKGVIDAGGFGYIHVDPAKYEDARKHFNSLKLKNHGVVMQEFIPQIYKKGELSFVFFNGKISHFYLKVPKYNEERVQPFYGGKSFHMTKISSAKTLEEIKTTFRNDLEMGTEEVELAYKMAEDTFVKVQSLLKRIDIPSPEYLRVDAVLLDSSNFLIMELEGIEPYLEMKEAMDHCSENSVTKNYSTILGYANLAGTKI